MARPAKSPTPAPAEPKSAARPSLNAVDLNLLVALDALLSEGNVTRAAERVGLTQPAMSHALGRLRALFDDPLLVRTPRGMLATPRAEALIEPIRRALGEIASALDERPGFDPRAARRVFTLASVDHCELTVLPPLLGRLSREAPGIDLRVRTLRLETVEEELEEGTVDLGISVLAAKDKQNLYKQRLFQDHFVCVVRADHPEVGESIALEQYVSLRHALISPRGRRGGFVDDALEKLGLSRRIALTVPHFLVAPLVVAGTDLVLTAPERIARTFAGILPLRMVAPPLELDGFAVTQFWHERQQRDPGHTWFRSLIQDVCRTL